MIKFASPVYALSLLVAFASAATLRADVHLPAIFGDHMVLQQDGKIPVWGTADAGEAITVTLGDKTGKATADASGKWRVDLDPVAMTAKALTLTVAGKTSVTFTDVLVGDVWVCSGQSNMEFDLAGNMGTYKGFGGASDAATAVPAASDPQLRLFIVKKKIALDPQTDVVGTWQVCTPDTAAAFSGVGYFFGQELRKSLNKPIGLIGTYWGGTPAQSWTSLSALQKDPPFDGYVNAIQTTITNLDKNKAAYPAAVAAYQAKMKDWNERIAPTYSPLMAAWNVEAKKAMAANTAPPPRPLPSEPMPKAPPAPDGQPGTPTVLYNGMIAPLIPYAIKGAIWYQGEANAGNATEYASLFPRMITDWRERWGQGDFPFLYVQLASLGNPQAVPSEGGWGPIREAQLETLSLPNTGMAVAVDVGNPRDIHPKDKHDVGLRLAQAAKHVAYGQDVVYSGPIYDSMKVEGNKIRLTFKDTGTGLKMGVPPWTWNGVAPPAPTELADFAIAGEDKKWVWAKAAIEGNDVVVSGDGVTAPTAVHYDWGSNPPGNLYNNEGLPASPFCTDDWKVPPMAKPPTPPAPPKT